MFHEIGGEIEEIMQMSKSYFIIILLGLHRKKEHLAYWTTYKPSDSSVINKGIIIDWYAIVGLFLIKYRVQDAKKFIFTANKIW